MALRRLTPERLSSQCRCEPDPSPLADNRLQQSSNTAIKSLLVVCWSVIANANWYDYFDWYPFRQTTPIEKAEDCDCDQPGTLTDTLIGSLESIFGKEAKDDEIIGAESLPTTYQGWGVRWRPEWFPDGAERNLVDANLRWADLRGADLWRAVLVRADLRGADLDSAFLWDANLRGALNLDPAADFAIWFQTTCPDGSMNIRNWPCFGDQLIPA